MTNSCAGERDFAVVVGVDKYANDFGELKGAVRDAQKMRSWLRGSGGVPAEHIFSVWSEQSGKPVLLKVEKAFKLLRESASGHPNRRLYVYFAGHGLAVEQHHANLLMADASAEELNQGLDAESYQRQLARIPWFEEQIFFYDCCRPNDDDHARRGTGAKWTLELTAFAKEVKQVVHFATSWDSMAYERPSAAEREHRGLFSTALLEGLAGYAAVRRFGAWVVTAQSLNGYIQRRMEELTKLHGVNQQPDVSGDPSDRIILAENVTPKRVKVRVSAPDTEQKLIVLNHEDLEVACAKLRGGRATVDLIPHSYTFCAGQHAKTLDVPTAPPLNVELGP